MVRRILLLLLPFALVAGCAPGIAPLYRDYAVEPAAEAETIARVRTALEEAGWALSASPAASVLTTEPRVVRRWGLYRVEVWLDVIPVGGPYVRVLLHPYRYFVTGNRSKIGYLSRGVQRAVVPDLNRAFRDHGLVALDSPVERDRERVREARR